MKKKTYAGAVGILAYIILSITDRFIVKIPDIVYIPTALLIIAMIIFGKILDKRKNNTKAD